MYPSSANHSSNHRRTDLGLGFGQRRAGSRGGGADGSRGYWGSLPEDCAAEEAREAAARGGRGDRKSVV